VTAAPVAAHRKAVGPTNKETSMHHFYRMLVITALLTASFAASSCQAPEQAPSATADQSTKSAGPLEGVWRETEIVVTGANASNIPNPQPSLYIFTPTHYAVMGTLGDQPRQLHKALDATDQERIAAYNSFCGNAGTYEITGETLTIRPVIARMPNFMAGGFAKIQFSREGDTLLLTEKSTDDHYRIGENVVPDPVFSIVCSSWRRWWPSGGG
jgi:hypothetical protein